MEIISVLILSCHYYCRLILLIPAINDRLFVQLQRHQSPPSEPYIYPLFCTVSNLLIRNGLKIFIRGLTSLAKHLPSSFSKQYVRKMS